MKMQSEEIRIRYKYRKMILSGKAKISLESARALVGPDCAYHLYGLTGYAKNERTMVTSDRAVRDRLKT